MKVSYAAPKASFFSKQARVPIIGQGAWGAGGCVHPKPAAQLLRHSGRDLDIVLSESAKEV